MNSIDRFLRMLKRGIFKWIKMPKKKKLSEDDKKFLGRIHEEYTWDAILEHLVLMSKSTIVSSKLMDEIRELRAICRKRYYSAEMSKKHPINHSYEKWEKCLECQCDMESDVVCGSRTS